MALNSTGMGWVPPVGKDKEWPKDEAVVLSREVVLTPAIIINIKIFIIFDISIMSITLSFSLPSLLASLVFPLLDPSFDLLDSFVALVLDPPCVFMSA